MNNPDLNKLAREAAERWFDDDDDDLNAYGRQVRTNGIKALSEVILSALTRATESTVVAIPLTRGLVAIVDRIDADLLSEKWHATGRGRAATGKTVYMHRVIAARMGIFGEVDHANGNRLDNRRQNLRECTRSQNIANRPKYLTMGDTSRFKGVSRKKGRNNKDSDRWLAQIQLNGKVKHLGYFSTEVEAAKAYDEAAREHYGEFAKPNFT